MNKIIPPDFASYDGLASWWNKHHACVCCGAPAPKSGHRYDCPEHEAVAKKLNLGMTAYMAWANSFHSPPPPPALECANCGNDCPENDYLCSSCRS